MKKIVLLLLAVMIFSACGNAPVQPSCPAPQQMINGQCCIDANSNGVCDAAEPKPVPQEQAPVVITAPVPPPPAPLPVAAPANNSVASLQAMVHDKVKSYSFIFRDNRYKVLGYVVRVDLGKFFRPDGVHPVNVVYLNLKTNDAEAYCEGDANIRRICDSTNNGPFNVPYTDYYEKLPVAWLDELADAHVENVQRNAQTIGSVSMDRWDVTKDTQPISLWVVSNAGVPVRVSVTDGKQITDYDYVQMSVNTVKAADMVPHPFMRT